MSRTFPKQVVIDTENLRVPLSRLRRMAEQQERMSNLSASTVVDYSQLPSHVQQEMIKRATTGEGIRKRSASGINVSRMLTPLFHPSYELSTLRLPASLEERNLWRRHYYQFNPYVSRACDLHATFPLSQFMLRCKDRKIQDSYNEIAEELNLFDFLLWLAQEYWVVGEAISYGLWDDDEVSWARFVLMNPDYLKIEWNPVTQRDKVFKIVKWQDEVKKIVDGGIRNPDTGFILQRLIEEASDVVECIRESKPYTLSEVATSHVVRKCNYFDIRGVSIIDSCFKTLMYHDKLREAQGAIADRHLTPLEISKLGTDLEPADDSEMTAYTNAVQQTWNSPNKHIIWNHALQYEMVGASGRMLPVTAENDQVINELAAGLKCSRGFLVGEGMAYANQSVALDVMIAEYLPFRQMLEYWVKMRVFAPIARARRYYRPRSGMITGRYSKRGAERELQLPEVRWTKGVLRDNFARINLLMNLAQQNKVPWTIVYEELNLDPDQIEEALRGQFEKEKRNQEKRARVGLRVSPLGGDPSLIPVPVSEGLGEGLDVGGPSPAPPESYQGFGGAELPGLESVGPVVGGVPAEVQAGNV